MLRIGHGYDVHRLCSGRKLILGGVDIPHEVGLLGHSDGDALAHAVIDSLLGAAAMGDIGCIFPDTDEKYKNADSIRLLQQVGQMLEKNGFAVCNIDCTIIAQRPKLRPFIDKMRENISASLNLDISAVSVKATTEEGLGFSGREEGIAVHSVCLINRAEKD